MVNDFLDPTYSAILAQLSDSTQWTIAIASLFIACIALLLNVATTYAAVEHKIRAKIKVTLRKKTFQRETIDGKDHHYIHLNVVNVRWCLSNLWRPNAENVRVFFSRIDQKKGEQWETIFETGNVMLQWQFEGLKIESSPERHQAGALTIQTMQRSDLAFVVRNEGFNFKTAYEVANVREIENILSSDNNGLRVFVHAQGTNSPPSRITVIELSGNGKNPDEFKFYEVPIHQALKDNPKNSEPPEV